MILRDGESNDDSPGFLGPNGNEEQLNQEHHLERLINDEYEDTHQMLMMINGGVEPDESEPLNSC